VSTLEPEMKFLNSNIARDKKKDKKTLSRQPNVPRLSLMGSTKNLLAKLKLDDAYVSCNSDSSRSTYESINDGECMSLSDHSPVRVALQLRVVQPESFSSAIPRGTITLKLSGVLVCTEESNVVPSRVKIVFPTPHDSYEGNTSFDHTSKLWRPSVDPMCEIVSSRKGSFKCLRVLFKVYVQASSSCGMLAEEEDVSSKEDHVLGQGSVDLERFVEGETQSFETSLISHGVYRKQNNGIRMRFRGRMCVSYTCVDDDEEEEEEEKQECDGDSD